jgi:hypothetical protein
VKICANLLNKINKLVEDLMGLLGEAVASQEVVGLLIKYTSNQ